MRIGHYMQGLWDRGGTANYICRVGAKQQALGHEVYYIDTRPLSNIEANNMSQGYCLISAQDERDVFVQANKLKLDIMHLHTSIQHIESNSVPIIRTVHNNNPYCPSGSRCLYRKSQPCDRTYSLTGCLWGHFVDRCGSVRPHRSYPGFKRTWQEMETLKRIVVIANSQFVKEQMMRAGYSADTIHVLHLPAPPSQEYVPLRQHDVPHFVFLGRIAPEKGLNWLLQAVASTQISAHLDIAGSGNPQQEKAIYSLASQLGLLDRVTFHGWLCEADALQLVQGARSLIFPSVWHEPAGMVSLEAASVGRPVIASRVGGIPEYAEKLQNVVLVAPNDVIGLAQTIDRLAMNISWAEQLGMLGQAKAQEHFALDQHIAQLTDLYEVAITRR